MPMHDIPYSLIAVLTIALIAALSPGASPPPVKIPICLYIENESVSKTLFYFTDSQMRKPKLLEWVKTRRFDQMCRLGH